ncbi:MAG: WG repeat-containing protein [Spirochaetes bacterium]|nr:WG repeat-containing protein [Spirochaetota bacterium]
MKYVLSVMVLLLAIKCVYSKNLILESYIRQDQTIVYSDQTMKTSIGVLYEGNHVSILTDTDDAFEVIDELNNISGWVNKNAVIIQTKYFPVKKGNKYGYITSDGKEVLPFIFNGASQFIESIACVKVGDKWGFCDRNGVIVIKPILDRSENFSNGFCILEKNGKYGVMNKQGKIVIATKYDYCCPFENGLAIVTIGKYKGCIDKSGKIVIPLKFGRLQNISNNCYSYSYDTNECGNVKTGIISSSGKILKNPIYSNVNSFRNNYLTIYTLGWKGAYGVLDKNMNYVLEPKYSYLDTFVSKEKLIKAKINKTDLFGYIDLSGKYIISPMYEDCSEFSKTDDLAAVKVNEKWNYINSKNKILISGNIVQASTFINGLAVVKYEIQNGKWKYLIINTAGKTIIDSTDVPFKEAWQVLLSEKNIFTVYNEKQKMDYIFENNGKKIWPEE